MENVRKLEIVIGGRWNGISFIENTEDIPKEVEFRQVARFCEALELSVVHKMIIKPSQFECPGARYAFGVMVDLKETMIEKVVKLKGYSPEYAVQLFENTPHFQKMPDMIGFNCMDEPDIVISQLQPEQVMRLLELYHIRLSRNYQTAISSIISACGNTAVRAYEKQDLAISFGCDDSRIFGGLSKDKLYVGLPYSLVLDLTKKLRV